MKQSVVILGARGSVPRNEAEFLRYGGATTCVVLRLAGQVVVLDAGTGMLNLANCLQEHETEIPVLLSHSHVDHILGLLMCPAVFDKKRTFDIYAAVRNGMKAEEQIRTLMSPPLWPIGPEVLPACLEFHDLPAGLMLGPIQVETMEGAHPGGVTLMRLNGGGKSVGFMTDCTLTNALFPKLTDFFRNCDLLLCDGQYSEQEWKHRANFGHSTWTEAARLGVESGAKQVRIIHHDPDHTDAELDAAEQELLKIHPQCAFACEGEEIVL